MLTITGTDGADTLNSEANERQDHDRRRHRSWYANKVTSLIILLQNGNDAVSLDSMANGGDQALSPPVTVVAGAGTHTVRAWPTGNDVTSVVAGHVLTVAT